MTNEKRLIDADEALRMMRNSQNDNPCTEKTGKVAWEEAHNCAISCVEACPPVDAVEVVRCKDCKHRKRPLFAGNGIYCEENRRHFELDDFCSYGERREGE